MTLDSMREIHRLRISPRHDKKKNIPHSNETNYRYIKEGLSDCRGIPAIQESGDQMEHRSLVSTVQQGLTGFFNSARYFQKALSRHVLGAAVKNSTKRRQVYEKAPARI